MKLWNQMPCAQLATMIKTCEIVEPNATCSAGNNEIEIQSSLQGNKLVQV